MLIDVDKLKYMMYKAAFIEDSNLQKWDSGCWIRYRLFEKLVDTAPPVDAVIPIRCKDCAHYENGLCFVVGRLPDPDNYCSWAIKKGECEDA